jgi:hypothetical protein
MKKIIIYLSFLSFAFLNAQEKKPLSIGEVITINSDILSEKRTLNIYLPDGYSKQEAYPVIYLLDGSANEDFIHVTGLVQFFSMSFNMPKTIIVGIANVDRQRDFTFHTDIEDLKKDYPTTGHSDKFIDFIESELQPYVEKHYKVSNKKYIIGQSLGGLLAIEILLKKPTLFTDYIITSPSLWWDDESLLYQAESLIAKNVKTTKNVYLAVGEEHPTIKKDTQTFFEILEKQKNLFHLNYKFLAKENHATILHNSLYEAFLLEFPYKEPKQ